ncbi:MAG: DsrE family protein [Proteobacteria bacterium]|nr:DsrE family protein [Pseudomonadota bacterium]
MTEKTEATGKLCVIWSSGDPDVAEKLVFMYTRNAKLRGWWEQVRLVVWGPSAKLLSDDPNLREQIGAVSQAGVELQACKACSDMYGVSDDLAALGIEVKYMGQPLTEMLKSDWVMLTF